MSLLRVMRVLIGTLFLAVAIQASRLDRKAPPQQQDVCEGNKVWNDCGSSCSDMQCFEKEDDGTICDKSCKARCECAKETPIWDNRQRQCVRSESECSTEELEPESESPTNCQTNKVWNDCGSSCGDTQCFEKDERICDMSCAPRCECGKDTPIWDKLQEKCVASHDQCSKPQSEPNDCPGNKVWNECGSPCGDPPCFEKEAMNCVQVCEARCMCPRETPIWDNVDERCVSSNKECSTENQEPDAVPGGKCATEGAHQEREWLKHCGEMMATQMCDCTDGLWVCMSLTLAECEETDEKNCDMVDCKQIGCEDAWCAPPCEPGQTAFVARGDCCETCQEEPQQSEPRPTTDCSTVRCADPICKDDDFKYVVKGNCCATCNTFPESKPDADCSRVSCMLPECKNDQFLYSVKGECCPTCHEQQSEPTRGGSDSMSISDRQSVYADETVDSGVSPALVKHISQLLTAAGQAMGNTEDEIDVIVKEILSSVDLGTLLDSATNYSEATDLLLKDTTVQGLVAAAGFDVDAVISHASSLDREVGDDDAAAVSIAACFVMFVVAVVSTTLF